MVDKSKKRKLLLISKMKEMLEMVSHRIRRPIAQLLGLKQVLSYSTDLNSQEVTSIAQMMTQSVEDLDKYTREFNEFLEELQNDPIIVESELLFEEEREVL